MNADAVVVGAGVVGAGVATSWEAKFGWEAWAQHLGGEDPAGMTRFQRTGMALLDVDIAPRGVFLPLLERVGVPYEEWDADTLARRVPGIDVGRYWPPTPITDERFSADATGTLGAVYTPDAGYVTDPQLAAQNLAWAARRHGARFVLHRRVTMGTSGNQFKNAPVIGRFLAAIVDQVENGVDHDTTPVQVTTPHTGATIDLSAFSRRRPANTRSSGTVMG